MPGRFGDEWPDELHDEYTPATAWEHMEAEQGLPDFLRHRDPVVVSQPERHTWEGWREVKISNGDCPLPGCSGRLDEVFYCVGCGQVSLPLLPVREAKAA